MSILIKGMEMPKSCDECPFITEADDYDVCYITEKFIPWKWADENSAEQIHPKPDWCPLIELPPHGRLIDADLLPWFLANKPFKCASYEDWEKLCDAIASAQTVIEAEEEK